jgi:hypothetical protein
MAPRTLIGFLAATLLGLGCRGSTAPYRDVETRLEVDRARIGVGEVLALRAIATNRGDRRFEFMAGCGEGLDFEVQLPSGERRFILRGLPSICPIFDSNILEPGETDTVAYAWTVPGPPGTYRLWAGGRVPEGLAARSPPVEVVVD